jgi:hypothetical protein
MSSLPRADPILPSGAVVAATGSKSSLKVGRLGRASVDVSAPGAIVVAETLVCGRQRPPPFPLRRYTVCTASPASDTRPAGSVDNACTFALAAIAA